MSKPELTKRQKEAVEHGKGNALVSASAGSGKTHVVIERIIRLIIDEGVPVKNILAVTFTKLAAEEMKEKLKRALTKKYLETKDKRLKRELEDVNSSDISTIDSFCSKLIKKYFYVIGVDSSVQVLEEGKKKQLTEQAMDDTFNRLYESGDEDFLSLVSIYASHRSDKGLKETIFKLYDFCERANGIDNLYEKSKYSYENAHQLLNEELKEEVERIAKYYGFEFSTLASSFVEDEKRRAYSENMVEILDVMANADDLFKFFNTYNALDLSLPRTKSKEGEYATLLSSTVKEFRARIENYQDIFGVDKDAEKGKLQDSFSLLEKLIKLVREYSQALSNLKAEENAVDFADIERYALQLLNVEEVKNEVLSLYDYVFIDEYQDVNDIQEEIINCVTRDNAFLVGDSKQCIYAFRGCNPEYFITKYRLYEKGMGTAIPLDYNFRSAPAVVNGVNSIFSGVMTEGYGGTNYAKNPMVYGNGYGDYEGVCQLHVVPKCEDEEKQLPLREVYSVKTTTEMKEREDVLGEVKLIVNLIKDRLGKEYYHNGEYKKIEFKDICILLRSIGGEARLGEELVQTLVKAGVPVSSSVKKNVKDYPEIKVLLNLLSLLVNAERDIPLATVMISLCSFTENDLATIRKEYKSDRNLSFSDCVHNYSKTPSPLGEKCKNFIAWLEEKRLIAEFLSVDELFNSILKETGYLAKITASTFGEARLKRIERFIAESVVGGKKLRAVEFESHVQDVLDDISLAESSGEDTVKVMTMHASKGLEFPVVIVAGLNKKFNTRDRSGNVIYEKKSGVAVKCYDEESMSVSENSARLLVKERIKKSTQVEELRLLYVALTRARCELYMITSANEVKVEFDKNSVSSMSDFLTVGNLELISHDASALSVLEKREDVLVAGREEDRALTDKIIENLSYKYPHECEINLPVKTSVSDVNKAGDEEYFARTDKFGSSSSEKGTAYHRFFELIDFYSEVTKELLDGFVKSNLMTKAQAEFIDVFKVKSILTLPIFEEIKGKTLLKEQKFCHLVPAKELYETESLDKVLIQGIADLIAIDCDGAILIDYKISTIEREEDIIKAYKTQMKLYKNAIENILKLKVKKVVLLNVLQCKTIEIE